MTLNICDNSLVYDAFGKRDRHSRSGPDSGVSVKMPSEISAVLKINLCGTEIVVLILLQAGNWQINKKDKEGSSDFFRIHVDRLLDKLFTTAPVP